jgi:hypothetical protein
VERDRFGSAADLVGERLAALAELGLQRSESFQHRERHLERIEHQNLRALGLRAGAVVARCVRGAHVP